MVETSKVERLNEITLPSGKKAWQKSAFKGKHIIQAQRLIGQDSDKMLLAIISIIYTVEGKEFLTLEDVEEMPGGDVLALMGEIGGKV